jgi:hypothetical protein
MWTRRQFLTRGSAGVLTTAGLALGRPFEGRLGDARDEALPDGSAARGMITPRTDTAVARGLEFLAARRHRDGSFGSNAYAGNTAVTSLAGLAFMAAGHQPGRGAYGRIVSDTLRFILSQEKRDGIHDGFLHNPNATPHGPMYGHGFATLFLAEAYGMVNEPNLRQEMYTKLRKAVKLILGSQNQDGGWRYNPESRDADLSVTICQIMALRSARNAGVAVPKSNVDKCIDYVLRCQDKREGYFRYTLNGGLGGAQGFARTAAGVAALNSAGHYLQPPPEPRPDATREEIDRYRFAKSATDAVQMGLRFLMQNKPGGGGGRPEFFIRPDIHYFYGHYYAVQVMWTAGGKYFEEWFPAIREELLATQRPDGCWQDAICAHYGTAMACIILQVPNNYLPILQK